MRIEACRTVDGLIIIIIVPNNELRISYGDKYKNVDLELFKLRLYILFDPLHELTFSLNINHRASVSGFSFQNTRGLSSGNPAFPFLFPLHHLLLFSQTTGTYS